LENAVAGGVAAVVIAVVVVLVASKKSEKAAINLTSGLEILLQRLEYIVRGSAKQRAQYPAR